METFLKEVLPDHYEAITSKVQQRLNKEFTFFVNKLENSLPDKGRCLICTLKLPCKHLQEIPNKQEKKEKTPKSSYWKLSGRELSLPVVDIEKLEKIQKFREKRISQDLEKISEMREIENKDKREKDLVEVKRVRYVEEQKKKLSGYQEELKRIRTRIMKEKIEDEEREKRKEEKFREYLEGQKRKIMEKEDQNKCSIGFFKIENANL